MNPQMFNSFLDGTKSAIEMAAVANATGLDVAAPTGSLFPPCGVDDLPHVLRPRDEGGVLDNAGAGRGGLVAGARRPAGVPRPALGRLRRAARRRTTTCGAASRQYGLTTDSTGRYAAMYKPYHLIGLELGISVASAACAASRPGSRTPCAATSSATAKRDLSAGEMLDGEGGYTV